MTSFLCRPTSFQGRMCRPEHSLVKLFAADAAAEDSLHVNQTISVMTSQADLSSEIFGIRWPNPSLPMIYTPYSRCP